MNVNRQEPAITKQFVLIPAGLCLSSRSTPIMAPNSRQTPRRIANSFSLPMTSELMVGTS
jgi:hypothetical protein